MIKNSPPKDQAVFIPCIKDTIVWKEGNEVFTPVCDCLICKIERGERTKEISRTLSKNKTAIVKPIKEYKARNAG